MPRKKQLINLGIYSYIALPFIIFAAGFLKWYFAIPFTVLTAVAVLFASTEADGIEPPKAGKNTLLKITFVILFITAMVILSGIGGFVWQNNDHATRNTIFDILTEYSWPPKDITAKGSEVALIYYIGFWLPSALIGKISSLSAGYVFMALWAVCGLFIIWYLLCAVHKKTVVYPLIIFLFFSGLDIFGYEIATAFFDPLTKTQIGKWAFSSGSRFSYHIEWWARYFQYSSHTTQLFWVFNQSIPAWIASLMLLLEKSNRNLVFIMGLTLLSSTLPFVGLVPIFIWCALCEHDAPLLDRPFTHDAKNSFLSLFTYQNVIGGGISGIVSFLYLKGNISSAQASTQASASSKAVFSASTFLLCLIIWACFTAVSLFFVPGKEKKLNFSRLIYPVMAFPLCFLAAKLPHVKLQYYILFILLEFLILAAVIFPSCKRSSLFTLTLICLMLIPFFTIGKSIDFCMRASVPLLAVLCLLATSALDDYFENGRQALAAILCVILMLGALTPVKEIIRTIEATKYEIQTKGKVENDSKTKAQVFKGRNFTGSTEDNIFFEIFAK